MLRVGAQLYTVRQFTQTPEGFLDSLKKVRDIGFKAVQISGAGKEIPIEFIADALKETGLNCVVTHIQYDDLLNGFDAVVKKHDAWRCNYVGIGGLPERYRSAEGYLAFAKEAGDIAKRLKDVGKTFVYHNHSHEFIKFGDKRGFDILLENAPEELQIEMDIYWVQNAGADPIQWIHKVAGRMDIMHYKDMDVIEGNNHIMAPIGGGNMNWDGILKALNDTGVKYGFVEQDVCRTNPFDCLKESFDFLVSKGLLV